MSKRQTTIVKIDISYLNPSTHNDESKELCDIERNLKKEIKSPNKLKRKNSPTLKGVKMLTKKIKNNKANSISNQSRNKDIDKKYKTAPDRQMYRIFALVYKHSAYIYESLTSKIDQNKLFSTSSFLNLKPKLIFKTSVEIDQDFR